MTSPKTAAKETKSRADVLMWFYSPTTIQTLTLTRLCDATDGHKTELLGSYMGFNSGFKISGWLRYDLWKG